MQCCTCKTIATGQPYHWQNDERPRLLPVTPRARKSGDIFHFDVQRDVAFFNFFLSFLFLFFYLFFFLYKHNVIAGEARENRVLKATGCERAAKWRSRVTLTLVELYFFFLTVYVTAYRWTTPPGLIKHMWAGWDSAHADATDESRFEQE